MTEPKNALIKQYTYLFSLHHVGFHVTDDALKAIAAMALKKNTGARGLRAILERVLMQAMFDIPDDPDVTAVVVTAEAVQTKTCVQCICWTRRIWSAGHGGVCSVVCECEAANLAMHTINYINSAMLLREPMTLDDFLGTSNAQHDYPDNDHHPQPMVGGV